MWDPNCSFISYVGNSLSISIFSMSGGRLPLVGKNQMWRSLNMLPEPWVACWNRLVPTYFLHPWFHNLWHPPLSLRKNSHSTCQSHCTTLNTEQSTIWNLKIVVKASHWYLVFLAVDNHNPMCSLQILAQGLYQYHCESTPMLIYSWDIHTSARNKHQPPSWGEIRKMDKEIVIFFTQIQWKKSKEKDSQKDSHDPSDFHHLSIDINFRYLFYFEMSNIIKHRPKCSQTLKLVGYEFTFPTIEGAELNRFMFLGSSNIGESCHCKALKALKLLGMVFIKFASKDNDFKFIRSPTFEGNPIPSPNEHPTRFKWVSALNCPKLSRSISRQGF